MSTIRVLLAEDHAMLREALCLLLAGAPDIEVVGAVACGQALLDCARQLRPDVVCMDLSMPGLGGAQTTRQLLGAHPRVKVIGLSAHTDLQRVAEICAAGALGYVVKTSAGSQLADAIRRVYLDQSYFSAELGITSLADLDWYLDP